MRFSVTKAAFLALTLVFSSFSTNLYAQGPFTAEFDDGDLTIQGENNTDQSLAIEGTGTPGEMRVIALDSGTTINGQNVVVFSGVFGDVTIDLKSGNSLVIMTEGQSETLYIGGDLEIKNKGNFPAVMLLDEVEVEGRIDIKTKNGDDALIANAISSGERTKINTGNGNDVVQIGFDSMINDELEVKTGGGADYTMLFLAEVFGETDIKAGGQEDTIGLYNSTLGELSVNGNGGDDLLEEFDVNFLEFDERSIEDDFVGGLPAMFAQARAFNTNFNDAVVLFGFFNLAD